MQRTQQKPADQNGLSKGSCKNGRAQAVICCRATRSCTLILSNAFSGDLLTPTIFHEDWWLNIATEGRYRVVEVAESGGLLDDYLTFCVESLARRA